MEVPVNREDRRNNRPARRKRTIAGLSFLTAASFATVYGQILRAPGAYAESIPCEVNDNGDAAGSSSSRTLRYCVTTVQANADGGTITFDATVTASGVALTSRLPDITEPTTIEGGAGVTIAAVGSTTNLLVLPGPTATSLTLSNLALQGFYNAVDATNSTNSTITMADSTVTGNTDNVFHTPMDAEKELQLPVLGLSPYLPLEPGLEISNSIAKMSASERFAIKESLRSLFTTFRLLRADRNIRMVGVTSSTQGEGKSTAVSIFARTLSDLGLKVLIVDSDMRLPMQARYLGIEQGEGLSTLLSDSNLKAVDLIQSVTENFDLMPSGPKPPDPAKLLNSSRCQDVVDEIRALPGYDIVLWDAPPCLMLSDPILLGEKLDGILFLVGLGKVSRELAPQACRRIKATGVDVLGLICNQVSFPSRLNDYGYEYGYYYHYAYAGAYGSQNKAYGNYGRGLKGYISRYRDSYLRTSSYGENTAGGSYISSRYARDRHVAQSYQDAAINGESGANATPAVNGSGLSTGSRKASVPDVASEDSSHNRPTGPLAWLGRKLQNPFGRKSKRTNKR